MGRFLNFDLFTFIIIVIQIIHIQFKLQKKGSDRPSSFAVWPLDSLIPLEEEEIPSNFPGDICWFE